MHLFKAFIEMEHLVNQIYVGDTILISNHEEETYLECVDELQDCILNDEIFPDELEVIDIYDDNFN